MMEELLQQIVQSIVQDIQTTGIEEKVTAPEKPVPALVAVQDQRPAA
jgi:hypothetical protein